MIAKVGRGALEESLGKCKCAAHDPFQDKNSFRYPV